MKNLVKMNLYQKPPSMSEKRQLIMFLSESISKNKDWLNFTQNNNRASGNSRSNSFDDTNGKKQSKSRSLLKWVSGSTKRSSGINIEDINRTKEA